MAKILVVENEPSLQKLLQYQAGVMGKIQIVDDDEIIHSIAQILIRSGYEVVCSTNGINGLNQYRLENPDLLITDLNMPYWTDMIYAEMLGHCPAYP